MSMQQMLSWEPTDLARANEEFEESSLGFNWGVQLERAPCFKAFDIGFGPV